MARRHSRPWSTALWGKDTNGGIHKGRVKHIVNTSPLPKQCQHHPTPLWSPLLETTFFLHLAHISSLPMSVVSASHGLIIWDLRPTLFSVWSILHFQQKPWALRGSKREPPMHLLRHNVTHIVVRSMGSRCWFWNNVMWSFIKIVQDGFEGSWGSWNHLLYEGIARLLLEVLKCCIQRNWSRDLRKAQKKSGNAKLSMVLVYTSSKAVKKVASKKRYQAWNGYRESMDNKLSRQNWELMIWIWNLLFYVAIFGFHVYFGVKEVRDSEAVMGEACWSSPAEAFVKVGNIHGYTVI